MMYSPLNFGLSACNRVDKNLHAAAHTASQSKHTLDSLEMYVPCRQTSKQATVLCNGMPGTSHLRGGSNCRASPSPDLSRWLTYIHHAAYPPGDQGNGSARSCKVIGENMTWHGIFCFRKDYGFIDHSNCSLTGWELCR